MGSLERGHGAQEDEASRGEHDQRITGGDTPGPLASNISDHAHNEVNQPDRGG
jgi:hypothetical protein